MKKRKGGGMAVPEDDAADLLRRMLSFRSVSGADGHREQRRFLDFLLDWLGTLPGYSLLRYQGCESGQHPFAHVRIDGQLSPAGRVLFACHLDVVPIGMEDMWAHDPWGTDGEKDGRYFGRGSCDMKGPIVSLCLALRSLASHGIGAEILFTSDEESGSAGAESQIDYLRGIERPAGIIVCEPTEGRIRLGHRGAYWIEVTATGKAAHGSTPELGVSAIYRLMDCIALCREGQGPKLRSDPFLGKESWNLGVVRAGGESPNLVPDRATGIIDYRIVSDDVDDITDWWEGQEGISQVTRHLLLSPVSTDRSDPWLGKLSGPVDPEPCFCYTDASIITKALPGIPIVIWGPGESSEMHTIDESIGIPAICHMAERYAQSLVDACAPEGCRETPESADIQ